MTDQMRAPYDAARALYPLLPQWYEETDHGINPEFDGLNAGGMPVFVVPAGYTLMPDEGAHEAGHAYFALLSRAQPTINYGQAYWAFRGFPGTWAQAIAASAAEASINAAWQLDPRESWAEAFARSCVPTHNEKTLTYGLDKDPLALRAWFQALNPATLPPVQKAPVVTTVSAPTQLAQRTMYDSTNPLDIPVDARMVAGYIDGWYLWRDEDWLRFPYAIKVAIAIHAATNDGHVLDVEWGAASPQDVPGWLTMRRAAGVDPSVYVNHSNWQACKDACAAAGVAQPHWWLASYDGIAQVPDGTVAKQYANEAITGAHYDLSAVAATWPGVDEEEDVAFKDDPDAQQFKNDMLNWQKAVNDRLAKDAHHKHPPQTVTIPESGEPETA